MFSAKFPFNMFNQVCDVSRFKTPVGIPVYIFCIGNLYSHPESMPVYLQDSCHIGGWWPYQWPSCFNVKTLECSCWWVISTTLNSMLCIGDHYPILLKIMGHEMSWIIRFQTYIIWYNPICIYIIYIYIYYIHIIIHWYYCWWITDHQKAGDLWTPPPGPGPQSSSAAWHNWTSVQYHWPGSHEPSRAGNVHTQHPKETMLNIGKLQIFGTIEWRCFILGDGITHHVWPWKQIWGHRIKTNT